MTNATLHDRVFRDLLDLVMVNDPWPLDDASEQRIKHLLITESEARGYDGWVEAYHEVEG